MAKKIDTEKKKMNPILWFLFAIVIPISITIALVTIILMVAGVDVTGWLKDKGKDIPVVSSFVDTEEEDNTAVAEKHMKSKLDKKNAEIDELKKELQDKEAMLEKLEQDIVKLKNKQKSAEKAEKGNKTNEEEKDAQGNTIKSMAKSFNRMDEEQAAKILQSLKRETALAIIKELKDDTRASVLEAMDPDTAAQLTQQFIDTEN